MRRVTSLLCCVIVMGLTGCLWSRGPHLSQAQLNALETREVDADFVATFNAASGAMFDAGYIVTMSDRQAGLLTGTKSIDRSRQRRWGNPQAEDTDFAISIMIRETSPRRSSVRVKTSINGQSRVNKKAIDQVWVLMQRQVLMTAPLAAQTGQP